MLLPLKDENPSQSFPSVVVALIIVNFLIFFYELSLSAAGLQHLVQRFGLTPYYLLHPSASPLHPVWLAYFTIFSSMFLHGGFEHIAGNMLFLWIFGNNVEDAEGHWHFLLFYLAAGTVAALTQTVVFPGSEIPSIGASGAIAGVLGAYIVLFPRARVITVILPFIFLPFYLPTYIVIGLWFLLQLFSGLLSITGSLAAPIAFFAHIGGFITGILLVRFLKQRRFKVKEGYRW